MGDGGKNGVEGMEAKDLSPEVVNVVNLPYQRQGREGLLAGHGSLRLGGLASQDTLQGISFSLCPPPPPPHSGPLLVVRGGG